MVNTVVCIRHLSFTLAIRAVYEKLEVKEVDMRCCSIGFVTNSSSYVACIIYSGKFDKEKFDAFSKNILNHKWISDEFRNNETVKQIIPIIIEKLRKILESSTTVTFAFESMYDNPPHCTITGCNDVLDIRDYFPEEWFDMDTAPEMWLDDNGYYFCEQLEKLLQESGFSNEKVVFDFR